MHWRSDVVVIVSVTGSNLAKVFLGVSDLQCSYYNLNRIITYCVYLSEIHKCKNVLLNEPVLNLRQSRVFPALASGLHLEDTPFSFHLCSLESDSWQLADDTFDQNS
jgi:hypothetical protein